MIFNFHLYGFLIGLGILASAAASAWLARRRAEPLGGAIGFSSTDKGAAFYVTIPLSGMMPKILIHSQKILQTFSTMVE